MKLNFFLVTAIALSLTGSAPVLAAGQTGAVSGEISVSGNVPSGTAPSIPGSCGRPDPLNRPFAEDRYGNLGNAAVVLKPVQGEDSPAGIQAVLSETACAFSPRVLVVPENSVVRLRNSGPAAVLLNLQPPPDALSKTIAARSSAGIQAKHPGIIRLESKGSPWMKAWIYVTDSPYYGLSDIHGNFGFKNVPAGKYTLVLWHEVLGFKKIPIQIKPGRTARFQIIWTVPANSPARESPYQSMHGNDVPFFVL